MKTYRHVLLAVLVVLGGMSDAHSQVSKGPGIHSANERLIGAWQLIRITSSPAEAAAPPNQKLQPRGILIYTADGHMSVQLMYPESLDVPANEYVHDGYEASFGTYDVNEAAHTLTHHVKGSNTRQLLVGKDLPRTYRFTDDGHLVITSADPKEHWSVIWEHY